MAHRVDRRLRQVRAAILNEEDVEARTASALRDTLDWLYNGIHTGHYSPKQLTQTEKTHCGSLVELNMQRRFRFDDGWRFDYRIVGVDVECKFSQYLGGWMIPPEAVRSRVLCLLLWADDEESKWSMGLVRTTHGRLQGGKNRDKKRKLNKQGRQDIEWLFEHKRLPKNQLLHLDPNVRDQVMQGASGAERLRLLCRLVPRTILTRVTIETLGQQKDPMKRMRANGGARSALKKEGIVILGHYTNHANIAKALNLSVPREGELMSVPLAPANQNEPNTVEIDGGLWRLARVGERTQHPAPRLPVVRRSREGATDS
ncbi:MAG: restriction endonuclease [Acidimicrobiaceae bacterium]|nr:restriction endonuclease [Acidimicrobiaceae bacterium]